LEPISACVRVCVSVRVGSESGASAREHYMCIISFIYIDVYIFINLIYIYL
jgi:hypothetical protein